MLQWLSSAQRVEALTLSNFWKLGSCRVPYTNLAGNAVRPSTVAQGPGLLDFLQPCCFSRPIIEPLNAGLNGEWPELQLQLDRGVPGNMQLEAHRSTFNANSFLPDLSSQLLSFTSWISKLRPLADRILHTTSEADLYLPPFPTNDFVA